MKRLLLVLLCCTAVFAQPVSLSWVQSIPNVNVTSNRVYRSQVSGGPYENIFQSTARITTWTDATVMQNEFYCYVVTAVTGEGESPYSNEVCVTTTFANAPTGLKVK